MIRPKAGYTILSFLLTLLFSGLLHAGADNQGRFTSTQISNQSVSHYSLHRDIEKALPGVSTLSLHKYQLRSQPTPSGDIPPFFTLQRLAYQTHEVLDPVDFVQPWFVTRVSTKTTRLSGWKDSNVLYKTLALQHA